MDWESGGGIQEKFSQLRGDENVRNFSVLFFLRFCGGFFDVDYFLSL